MTPGPDPARPSGRQAAGPPTGLGPDAPGIAELLRELTPAVLGALVRRFGQFDACEDAMQDALLAAVQAWSWRDLPENPKGWLLTVASRRMIDEVRSEHARRRREQEQTAGVGPPEQPAASGSEHDDSLALLFLCCHPSLSDPSQVALTLRAVGGLTTPQIAADMPFADTDPVELWPILHESAGG